MALVRSVSGVRGTTGSDITEELARRYGRAFAEITGEDVAVGWDSRRGGGRLVDAVSLGLREGGRSVRLLGVVPTPTVGLAVRQGGLGGGVSVTASHNPETDNGLKFFSSEGIFLGAEAVARLFELADGPELPRVEGAVPVALEGAVERHIERVLGSPHVDAGAVRAAAPRVVVDCVNAAGSVILPGLLRALGCDVVELSTRPGGGFTRGAEPVPNHLTGLSGRVVAEDALLGLACDPDADRLALVDERGRPVGEEYTLVLAARPVLSNSPAPVVVNVSTSRMIEDVAGRFGVPVHRSAVGEINVVEKMFEVSAVVGGEGNGGVILPVVHPGRDAATAAALVITGLAGSGSTLSDAVAEIPSYEMVKMKIAFPRERSDELPELMASAFPDGEQDLTDGAKTCWTDRWVHARMSGTEPVLRVIAEARTAGEAQRLVSAAVDRLERLK
ncbi:MAG: phosphoglucosamine mutase [Candidatus Eisenbacteria bacterium]|nr:phosphoglucosamine mutase [Candidatus Eisenbacteria bacterium]